MLFTKSYYRLEEAANRWNCAIEDLLYLAEAGKLAIALPQELDERFYYILNPRDFNKTISGNSADNVEVVLITTTPECARHCLVDKEGNILSDEEVEAMPEKKYKAARRRHEKAKKLYFATRTFTTDNLVITQEELERFEREKQDFESKQDYQKITPANTKSTRGERRKSKRISDLGFFLYPIADHLKEDIGRAPNWQEIWREVWNMVAESEVIETFPDGSKKIFLNGNAMDVSRDGRSLIIPGTNEKSKVDRETVRNWHRRTYSPTKSGQ